MRRSDRLQKDIPKSSKDNVPELAMKRNIEGNNSCFSNCFSTLDNEIIPVKSMKMGVNLNSGIFYYINK